MRKTAELNVVKLPLWEEPKYLDLLNVDPADLDWDVDHDPGTRAVVILVPTFPQWMRDKLNRERKRIARLGREDRERDITATNEYVKLLQKALDAKTYQKQLARLNAAAKDIQKTALRIERAELMRLRKGKGFRQRST